MEGRKVMKIRSSFFINIPLSIAERLEIKKGDMLWFGNLSRGEVIITKSLKSGKVVAGVEGIEQIRTVYEECCSNLRRFSRGLERTIMNNIGLSVMRRDIRSSYPLRKPKVNKRKVYKS